MVAAIKPTSSPNITGMTTITVMIMGMVIVIITRTIMIIPTITTMIIRTTTSLMTMRTRMTIPTAMRTAPTCISARGRPARMRRA